MLALLLALVLLLPVLAVLQYRWIGALSEGEQVRMQRALHASVMQMHDDLNQQLEQAHATFLIPTETPAKPLSAALTIRYETWLTKVPHPDLLAAVFVVRNDSSDAPTLEAFHLEAKTLTETSWPDSLGAWQAYFTQANTLHPREVILPVDEAALPASPPGIPVPLLEAAGSEDNPPQMQPVDHVLLLFDASVFSREILPALTQQHLAHDGILDYDVLIQRRAEPAEVIYRSAPGVTLQRMETPDLTTNLGQFRWMKVASYANEEVAGRVVTTIQRDSSIVAMVARLLDQGITEDADTFLDPTFIDQDRREIARRISSSATDRPPLRLETARETGEAMHPGGASQAGKIWELRVQHRAGSIEAAVMGMRRRNLAVSFGALLMLGLAAGLLYVSARRARRLAEQQTAFVAGVSHELRTPLAVIRSAAENLADGLVEDPAQARRYGSLIHAEGRRLSDIVEQALALAGAQSQHASLNLRPINIAPLLAQALERCRRDLDEAGVEVTLAIRDDLPPVQADAMALEAAICNLITNAQKYGNGAIQIEALRAVNEHGEEVYITVRDQGAGIPAHEQPYLFEPFYRGEAAQAAQIRGSGLGLSLVKQTVEAHGGHVSVESEAGQGSAFTIHLPASSL